MKELAVLSVLLPGPALAEGCRLALVLALDVSSSVSAAEDRLQRDGLAAALVADEVVAAFLQGTRPVALAAFEWSGRWNQQVLAEWRLIAGPEDLEAVAAAIVGSSRSTSEYPTALGYALGYGAGMLRDAPPCDFQTIDVSGDGRNNEGFPPELAYRAFPFDGVTVNGLAIETGDSAGLIADYYAAQLIRGPLAFVEVARGYAEYERAMRRKLERELAVPAVGLR